MAIPSHHSRISFALRVQHDIRRLFSLDRVILMLLAIELACAIPHLVENFHPRSILVVQSLACILISIAPTTHGGLKRGLASIIAASYGAASLSWMTNGYQWIFSHSIDVHLALITLPLLICFLRSSRHRQLGLNIPRSEIGLFPWVVLGSSISYFVLTEQFGNHFVSSYGLESLGFCLLIPSAVTLAVRTSRVCLGLDYFLLCACFGYAIFKTYSQGCFISSDISAQLAKAICLLQFAWILFDIIRRERSGVTV